MTRKLGKHQPRIDERTLPFSAYLTSALPPIPQSKDWATKIPSWPMYLNDQLGDCVIAAAAHDIQQWTWYASKYSSLTDAQVLAAYEAVGGYVPGNPSTDNGCAMLDALNYWRNTGMGGHQIAGYVSVNPRLLTEVKQAISLFGNCYVGVQLPVSAQNQTFWSVPAEGLTGDGAPGSWGGHCVPLVAYGPSTFCCVTWGALLRMSHTFLLDYCDEAYAIVTQDWIDAKGKSPSGFNIAQLQTDLDQL